MGGRSRICKVNLRKLDSYSAKTIAIQKIPFKGLGMAINDRLMRAASKK